MADGQWGVIWGTFKRRLKHLFKCGGYFFGKSQQKDYYKCNNLKAICCVQNLQKYQKNVYPLWDEQKLNVYEYEIMKIQAI